MLARLIPEHVFSFSVKPFGSIVDALSITSISGMFLLALPALAHPGSTGEIGIRKLFS
jgi:hypothetical protein